MAEEEDKFPCDLSGGGFMEWDCLGVSGGVIHDVFMAPGRFQEQSY